MEQQQSAVPQSGHTFEFTNDKKVTKKFKTLLALMIIPGVNDNQPMTSLEVSTDLDAQAYLVKNAVGSAIEEVFDAPAAPAE